VAEPEPPPESFQCFAFVREDLTFQKLTKTPLIYSVSRCNFGRLGALFGGLSPSKLSRGDWNGRNRESNHMRALVAGDTSGALKRHKGS